MNKFNIRSGYVLVGGILSGWVVCITILAQFIADL